MPSFSVFVSESTSTETVSEEFSSFGVFLCQSPCKCPCNNHLQGLLQGFPHFVPVSVPVKRFESDTCRDFFTASTKKVLPFRGSTFGKSNEIRNQ